MKTFLEFWLGSGIFAISFYCIFVYILEKQLSIGDIFESLLCTLFFGQFAMIFYVVTNMEFEGQYKRLWKTITFFALGFVYLPLIWLTSAMFNLDGFRKTKFYNKRII